MAYSTPLEGLLHYRFGSTMASIRFRILPAESEKIHTHPKVPLSYWPKHVTVLTTVMRSSVEVYAELV